MPSSHQAKQLAVEAAAKKAAKKGAPKQAPPPPKTYRVIHRTFDHHNNAESHDDETVGRYASYDLAKAKASAHLLEQWDRDFFEEYTESEEGEESGLFEVYGLCPEGEEMWVFVEEEEPLVVDPVTKPGKPAPRTTYRVILRMKDNQDPDEDGDHTVGRYVSYSKAKAHVRRQLRDPDNFDEYEESEKGEVSGGFEVFALSPDGELFWVWIEKEEPLDESESEGEGGVAEGGAAEEDASEA
ncbi:glycosylphosphatidylinositol anchor biosynthesis [Vanrija albida]|uniref:Glycosylphosphatidylinositol anchor biosynthesis n=1 Tax=Vanrija albida TaxID=181172 RepID=A0ABR3Q9L4_9TREE